ncbi:RNA-binding protein [Mastigocoleus testarum]|uniref:hypothetical protein n=1 Tax=Mastigocoleus testarum TaxID=996925 RepID=UPI0007C76FA6|nr:hypothetical protein [Mastigocoleus testarum]
MKILAIGKIPSGVPLNNVQTHLAAEAEKVWQLYISESLREIYLRTDQPGAVVVLECVDVEAAKAILATLPLVKAGMLDFDFIPLGPFRTYELLFASITKLSEPQSKKILSPTGNVNGRD